MAKTKRRFYRQVPANSSEVDEFIPNAGTFYISKLGGNAGASPATSVQIIWDYQGAEEILLSTHGDANHQVDVEVVGDGVKTLAIKLINDQQTSDVLGGFWTGSD